MLFTFKHLHSTCTIDIEAETEFLAHIKLGNKFNGRTGLDINEWVLKDAFDYDNLDDFRPKGYSPVNLEITDPASEPLGISSDRWV